LQLVASGPLKKMVVQHSEPVSYKLPIGNTFVDMNELIGKSIRLIIDGAISCTNCGRRTNKSFAQGYCYPCFAKLAQCDSCIMSPEKCHYHVGTCREPSWGEAFCFQDHFVYLANSSGVKVGITRGTQIPTRWIDQGAIQALPIVRVKTRLQSGLLEVVLKNHVADKTNWRTMLKGEVEDIDLIARWAELKQKIMPELNALIDQYGIDAFKVLENPKQESFVFPVDEYPTKVTSLNFDKTPTIEGVLKGIKGQYLILDNGVLNIRKFGSYHAVLFA
jgi:hypothetical protein